MSYPDLFGARNLTTMATGAGWSGSGVYGMAEGQPVSGLFPMEDDSDQTTNVVALPDKAGILSSHKLREMRDRGLLKGQDAPILDEQIQPASLDLRLGSTAYRVRASFLPGRNRTVHERMLQLESMYEIDLSKGAVLERGAVYVVQLQEWIKLNSETQGKANPKSSTGRLDVLTRLITDNGVAFDTVEAGYKGPLYIEIAPLTYSVVVRPGDRLNQLRLYRGLRPILPQTEVMKLFEKGELVRSDGELSPPRNGRVPVTIDLRGSGPGDTIGYKARESTNIIDLSRVGEYDPAEYWERITSSDGFIHLDRNDFYILATREDVGIPRHLAAEMIPYDTNSGEFRVHYAGFFDPGFGWSEKGAGGSKAVLEVRSHGVPFTLEHGQVVGWMEYSRIGGD